MGHPKQNTTRRSHIFHINMLLLVSLTVLFTVVNSAYLGPRYGKREFDGEILGRFAPRSDSGSNRHVQVRSGAKFYSGTRFGGKRSYWAPKPIEAAASTDLDEHSGVVALNLSESPYDCFYIPQVGVRCLSPEDSASWTKQNDDISRKEDRNVESGAGIRNKDRGDGDILSTNDAPMP